jgi:hypothetical protein
MELRDVELGSAWSRYLCSSAECRTSNCLLWKDNFLTKGITVYTNMRPSRRGVVCYYYVIHGCASTKGNMAFDILTHVSDRLTRNRKLLLYAFHVRDRGVDLLTRFCWMHNWKEVWVSERLIDSIRLAKRLTLWLRKKYVRDRWTKGLQPYACGHLGALGRFSGCPRKV